jgi:type III secretory pathway component EscU
MRTVEVLMGPIFIKNSVVPKVISIFSPIDVYAITLFPFVFLSEGLNEETRMHETIHFQQYMETLVIGFLIIYVYDYVLRYIKYGNGEKAYFKLRAEQESYDNDSDPDYLSKRKRFEWIFKYSI